MQDQDRPDAATTAPSPLNFQAETEPFQDKTETLDVTSDEVIDRSVQQNPQFFRWGEGDQIRVSASAFNDRSYEPSFYREKLCDAPPYSNPPRMNPDDAVASVAVGTIREQDAITFQSGNTPMPTKHKVDVKPQTDGHHKAHVVVFTAPEFKTKGGFARLKELLAQIVGDNWAVRPSESFLKENKEQIPRR